MRRALILWVVAGCTTSAAAVTSPGDEPDAGRGPVVKVDSGVETSDPPDADITDASVDAPKAAGTITRIDPFSDANPGALTMYEYVPPDMPAAAPVVVALHGCTQTANDYTKAGWNVLADAGKFYVVYAQQTSANNAATCFN